MATFTVTASGSPPPRFQWNENGTPIDGATSSTYTTPAVVATDNGASFTVAVTNDRGSLTSTAASLTVLPRVPRMGDWRFQGIDLLAGTLGTHGDLLSFQSFTLPDSIGTTLEVGLQFGTCGSAGPSDCAWVFFASNPPAGTLGPTSVYTTDSFDNLDVDFTGLATGNTVITSLDLEPANQIFALGAIQTSQPGGFQFATQTVSPAQLQTVATQLGTQSRVITALSYDAAGNVLVVSYGWLSDAVTTYAAQAVVIPSTSTSVATADSNAIASALVKLASQGYIITGMGGNAANGLLIVGTRVQGDTLSRPIEIYQQTGNQGQVSSGLQSLWGTVLGTTPNPNIQFAEQYVLSSSVTRAPLETGVFSR